MLPADDFRLCVESLTSDIQEVSLALDTATAGFVSFDSPDCDALNPADLQAGSTDLVRLIFDAAAGYADGQSSGLLLEALINLTQITFLL